jgi:hypothetical protein
MSSFQQINCFVIKPTTSDLEVFYSSLALDKKVSSSRTAYTNSILISEFESNLSDQDKEYEINCSYDEYFTRQLIEEDYFSNARIDFFMHDLISKTNTKIIKRGFVIHYKTEQYRFTFKLEPLKNFLFNRKINQVYSKSCRAEFGDKHCKLDLRAIEEKLGFKPQCNKTKSSCREYNNIINFRGE